jgi:soluble lytic murein transglycosylase-like protein
MLHNLSDAGAKGYDDTLGKGVSYQEAKRYFATGQMPESLKKPAAQKNGKTPEQNVDDAISHMLDFVNNLPNSSSSSSAPVKVSAIGPSPLASTIAASAEKHNVPPNIAAALFHTETSGGRNNKTSDKGAMGPGQIMPATAAAYGKDVKSMSPEDNVDLALQILSDNYKRTGNWEDALAMYHSGHDLRTATVRGLSDGHMKTADYVSSTMAAASSISPENLKKYGYVRY